MHRWIVRLSAAGRKWTDDLHEVTGVPQVPMQIITQASRDDRFRREDRTDQKELHSATAPCCKQLRAVMSSTIVRSDTGYAYPAFWSGEEHPFTTGFGLPTIPV
jgi:hypothetical protein